MTINRQHIEKAFLARKIKGMKDLSAIGFVLIAQDMGGEKVLTERIEELRKTKLINKDKEIKITKSIHEHIKRGIKILRVNTNENT
jgi:hypothetical protein